MRTAYAAGGVAWRALPRSYGGSLLACSLLCQAWVRNADVGPRDSVTPTCSRVQLLGRAKNVYTLAKVKKDIPGWCVSKTADLISFPVRSAADAAARRRSNVMASAGGVYPAQVPFRIQGGDDFAVQAHLGGGCKRQGDGYPPAPDGPDVRGA